MLSRGGDSVLHVVARHGPVSLLLAGNSVNTSGGSGMKELTWVGLQAKSVDTHPLTGPIVFALFATALAWNVPDVALLIAVASGGSCVPWKC